MTRLNYDHMDNDSIVLIVSLSAIKALSASKFRRKSSVLNA